MSLRKIPLFAAALLLSAAPLALGPAQAGEASAVVNSQAIATHGTGASNRPDGQPAGMVTGSGGTPTGTSTGDNASNRGDNADNAPARVIPAAYHHPRHHMMRHHRRHHHMMHHTTAMGGAMHGGTAMTPAGDGMMPTGGGGMGRSVVHNGNGVGVGSQSLTGPANRSTTNSGDTGSATTGGPNGAKPPGH